MTIPQIFTCTICTTLMLLWDVFVLVHPHLSIKKYLIFFFSFFSLFALQLFLYEGALLLVTLTVTSILLVNFTKKLYSLLYIPLAYIVNCVILHIVIIVIHQSTGISIEEINYNIFYLIITFICTIIGSTPILYLFRILFQKYLIRIFEHINKKLLILITVTFVLFAFLLYIFSCYIGIIDVSIYEAYILVSLLITYSLFTISMIFIVLHAAKKNYEAQKKVAYLENLNEYTRNLEMVYNNLRSFKHDYINIMASLAAYIDEKKYDELETFFYDHILPMQKNLTQNNTTLNNLLHVNVLELKSILYTKLLLAVNQNIEVNIDIPDTIDCIHMDPVDLTRMLGIYLDNAIEACLETEHPVINFHLGKLNDDVVFIISNTFLDKGLSISQMHKKDVTTKGHGHGIGLHNVSEILNRYTNIYHETLMENGLFIQQIQVS